MNLRTVAFVIFLALFAGGGVMAGLYFMDAREEYLRFKGIEERNRARLEEAEAQVQKEERILERLRSDPVYVEMEIRRKLGYAKKDEAIFRFEQ
jgi:cell division protein FtsB